MSNRLQSCFAKEERGANTYKNNDFISFNLLLYIFVAGSYAIAEILVWTSVQKCQIEDYSVNFKIRTIV